MRVPFLHPAACSPNTYSLLPPWLRDVFEGLAARPGRTALAAAALAAGFAALALLLAAQAGLRAAASELQGAFGADAVLLAPAGGPEADASDGLREAHLRVLRTQYPDWLVAGLRRLPISPDRTASADAAAALAASPDLAALRGWRPVAGRRLDAADEAAGARYALATASLCHRRGWRVGDAIPLRDQLFTLVGILPDEGATAGGGAAAEGLIVVPLSAWPAAEGRLDAIFVRGGHDPARTATRAQQLLEQPDLRAGVLSVTTADALLEGVRRTRRTVDVLAGGATAFGLALGAALLGALLAASVRERTPEIGLRRALGATRAGIAGLFVGEACLVTGASALAGVALALPAARALAAAGLVPLVVVPAVWLVPPLGAIILGALAAWPPARAAARLPPAEALRDG